MKTRTKYLSIIVLLVVVAALLTACTGGTATPAPTATGTATAKPTVTAQPAGKVIKWNMQGINNPGTDFFDKDDIALADKVAAVTNGRIQIGCFGPGGIVPFNDTTKGVQQGTLDCAKWWTCYDMGMRPVTALYGTMPFGFNNCQEYQDWMLEWGGLELAQECYGEWGVVVPICYPAGSAQIAGQTKKEYKTYKDMKGKIFRSSGLAAEVLEAVGMQTVFIAAGDLFTAIERGVIDVVEFGGPSWNYRSAYHEVAPYIMGPGWHEPASMTLFLVNQDRYAELPDDLRTQLNAAIGWHGTIYGAYNRKDDINAMQAMFDYGCVFNRLPDDDLQILHDAWFKIADQKAADDDLFKRTWESWKTWREKQDTINRYNWDLSFTRVEGLPDKIIP